VIAGAATPCASTARRLNSLIVTTRLAPRSATPAIERIRGARIS
jgi:hypothetical protein